MYQQLVWASQLHTKNHMIEDLMNRSCPVGQRNHRSTAGADMSIMLRMKSVKGALQYDKRQSTCLRWCVFGQEQRHMSAACLIVLSQMQPTHYVNCTKQESSAHDCHSKETDGRMQ